MEDDTTKVRIVKQTIDRVEPLENDHINIDGLLIRAEREADEIEDSKEREKCYAAIALMYNEKDRVEEAWKIYHKIHDSYIKSNVVYPHLKPLPGGRRYTLLMWLLVIAAIVLFGWLIWWVTSAL